MGQGWGRRARAAAVAVVAAALGAACPAVAQDVTLTARDGGLALTGDLQGYDGEFFRILAGYGLLTVDAAGVICSGPACPDLTAPQTGIRITGAADPALALLPGLWAAFADARGLTHAVTVTDTGFDALLADTATGQPLARVTFAPAGPEDARTAVADARADLAVATAAAPSLGSRVLALDPLVALVARDNPLATIRTADLAAALTGRLDNWAQMGGPDMPVVVHGLPPGHALRLAAEARLGAPLAATVLHDSPAALARAVARDPWALTLAGQSAQGPARALPMTDACDFPLPATTLAVKAEDYPLVAPVHLLVPRRRLPLIAREFLEFLATDAAQAAVARAGYVDRRPGRAAVADDGQRLLNAIRNAGPEVPLAELQRLALAMAGAERVSLTFRFEDGSSRLDAHSRDNLADLARLIGARAFDGWTPVLAGFSDGSGNARANLDLSRSRANAVRMALAATAPDLAETDLPEVEAFGEALPIACDSTAAGRQANRRVELWLRPDPGWMPPAAP